jgi:Rrf2 family iron-sulfur cluster assembly transcriptional regulator
MELTKAGEYGLLGTRYLAQQPKGKVVNLSQVSKAEGIPEKFLAKVFQGLTRVGLVASHRGAKGGFSLARPANQITIRQIIESVQGPIYLLNCLRDEDLCVKKGDCPIRKIWSQVQDSLREILDQHTLADLIS